MRTVVYWFSLILIFTIPIENIITFGASGTTVARATGLFVAALWIVMVVATGRLRKPHLFHVALYLFVLWNVASVFWSINVDRTMERLVTYFQLAALVFILWDLLTSPAWLEAALQAYVIGAYFSIGSTIINYLAGNEAAYLRYAATGFNANDLGLVLALGIPVAWHLAISGSNSKTTQKLRLVNYTYIPAAVFAILLTASRGSLLATLPAFLFVIWSFTRLHLFLRILIPAASIAALFALQPLVPQSSLQRLATTDTSIAELDLGGRVSIWREGIAVFAEHPLFGIGYSTFKSAVESGSSAHNTFLSVLVEVGLIGFFLFITILAVAVHQAANQSKWYARFWLTVLLVWALGASVHTWEYQKPTWLFLSLIIVSASLWARQEKSMSQVAGQTQQIPSRRKPALNIT